MKLSYLLHSNGSLPRDCLCERTAHFANKLMRYQLIHMNPYMNDIDNDVRIIFGVKSVIKYFMKDQILL